MIKVEIKQNCYEWTELIHMIKIFAQLHPLEMERGVPYDQIDDLVDASEVIGNASGVITMCKTYSCVLFSEPQLAVLVAVGDWFDKKLISWREELQRHNPEGYAIKRKRVNLIKNNLLGYENKTEKPATAPKNYTNDSPNLN